MNGEAVNRCGWSVTCSSASLDQDTPPMVCISKDTVRFYLPHDLYDDLDDEAFLALCETKRS